MARAAGSDCRGTAKDCAPARAKPRFGDSDLCDSNNDRGRVGAACGSRIDDRARA
jgi:hypothetical protein